jgi:hypothetical protein
MEHNPCCLMKIFMELFESRFYKEIGRKIFGHEVMSMK